MVELYRKLDENGGKKMISKMAGDRTEDRRDVTRGAVIKDNNRRLITEIKAVLRIWAGYYKELLNGTGAAIKLPRSPELGKDRERYIEVEEIGQEEVETQCTR